MPPNANVVAGILEEISPLRLISFVMPWSFKVAIAFFVVFTVGALLIGFACFEGGWQSLDHFVWGFLTAGAGLIGALLFSVICAVTRPKWRTRSLVAGALAILLFAGLLLFARVA